MVLSYAATAASGCVRRLCAGPSSLSNAARNDHKNVFNTTRKCRAMTNVVRAVAGRVRFRHGFRALSARHTHSPRTPPEAGRANYTQTPGPHSHGRMCGRYGLRYTDLSSAMLEYSSEVDFP